MSNDAQYIVIQPPALADTVLFKVVKASAIYGGFTVIRAYVTAGAAGTANPVLQNYGASGTVAGGTVAAFSGTTVFTAGTPQLLTVTAANQFIDDDEWLVLKMDGALPASSTITIETVAGITSQG
jgi:hypothetical protein